MTYHCGDPDFQIMSEHAAHRRKGRVPYASVPRAEGGFPCPQCNGGTRIVDTRPTIWEGMTAVRRRHHCTPCQNQFTTYETERLTPGAGPDISQPGDRTLHAYQIQDLLQEGGWTVNRARRALGLPRLEELDKES